MEVTSYVARRSTVLCPFMKYGKVATDYDFEDFARSLENSISGMGGLKRNP